MVSVSNNIGHRDYHGSWEKAKELTHHSDRLGWGSKGIDRFEDFLKYELSESDYNKLFVKAYNYSFFDEKELVAEFLIGIIKHGYEEYADLEKAMSERAEFNEYEIVNQIERIKQEQRNRENRLYSELESQRRLNEERVAQERQSIQSSLDSTRQNSYDRINQVQQEINNAERNFEQQTQQQVNLPGIVSLIGSFAKLFIGN